MGDKLEIKCKVHDDHRTVTVSGGDGYLIRGQELLGHEEKVGDKVLFDVIGAYVELERERDELQQQNDELKAHIVRLGFDIKFLLNYLEERHGEYITTGLVYLSEEADNLLKQGKDND